MEENQLWIIYCKAAIPQHHPGNMSGDDAIYASVAMYASDSESAREIATAALRESDLELLSIKVSEPFDQDKSYSHDEEIVKDIRKTANKALESGNVIVGGFIDPEIEEEEL